jgi:hypothetical protein
MALSAREEIAALRARLEALEAELRLSKAPPPPPPAPAKPPAWAQQSTNVGMLYCGEPSVPQVARGVSWIRTDPKTGYRKFPDGLLRDETGAIVPHPVAGVSAERPIGRPHDAKHTDEIKILDRIVDRFERTQAEQEATKLLDRLAT